MSVTPVLPLRPFYAITGADSGLGFAISTAMLRRHQTARVILTGNETERIAAAQKRLARRFGAERVFAEHIDLARLASVRALAGVLKSRYPPLEGLICNAAVQFAGALGEAETGAEQTFSVNHLGHFLLANLLIDHMAEPARIVFITSGTHDPRQRTGMPAPIAVTASDTAFMHRTTRDRPPVCGQRAYATSKLCNILTACEIARRLATSGRTSPRVNAFDPGFMPGTGLARSYPAVFQPLWRYVLPALLPALKLIVARGNTHSPKESAENLVFLMLSGALDATSGGYFEGRRQTSTWALGLMIRLPPQEQHAR